MCRQGPEDVALIGYVDSDLAGDQDEGRSTTGYVFCFAWGPFDGKSQE